MNKFSDAAKKYRHQAGSLMNANGANLIQDSSNFMGQSQGFMGQGSQISRADGAAPAGQFSTLDDANKYYTATLTNTNTGGNPVTCTLFGANQYGTTDNQAGATPYSQAANGFGGAYVTIEETSHGLVRGETLNSPFWINGLRYTVETTPQFAKIGIIQKLSSAGTLVQNQFRPLSFRTSYQQQSLQVDATGYKFGVDGQTSFLLPTIANETVTMIMQIGGRFTPSNIVDGSSPLEVASLTPLSSGLTNVNIIK